MFGNLVRIELIRLFKSRVFRYGLAIGILLMLADILIIDFTVSSGALTFLDNPQYGDALGFEVFMYLFASGIMVGIVAPVSVIVTTCGYYKHRLAVNIEGANRNRFKLWLSELTGIVIFVAALCIVLIPGLILILIGNPSDIVKVITDREYDLANLTLAVFISTTIMSFFAYLIAKLFIKASVSLALSAVLEILLTVLTILSVGMVASYNQSGHALPGSLEKVFPYIFVIVPFAVVGVLVLIRHRKMDRI